MDQGDSLPNRGRNCQKRLVLMFLPCLRRLGQYHDWLALGVKALLLEPTLSLLRANFVPRILERERRDLGGRGVLEFQGSKWWVKPSSHSNVQAGVLTEDVLFRERPYVDPVSP